MKWFWQKGEEPKNVLVTKPSATAVLFVGELGVSQGDPGFDIVFGVRVTGLEHRKAIRQLLAKEASDRLIAKKLREWGYEGNPTR
jgi:hypothetical protein